MISIGKDAGDSANLESEDRGMLSIEYTASTWRHEETDKRLKNNKSRLQNRIVLRCTHRRVKSYTSCMRPCRHGDNKKERFLEKAENSETLFSRGRAAQVVLHE